MDILIFSLMTGIIITAIVFALIGRAEKRNKKRSYPGNFGWDKRIGDSENSKKLLK